MKSNRNIGLGIGIFFLLSALFAFFSGYIIPGRDPDIGAFQFAFIIICGVVSLSAFDFALLWSHHLSLNKREWVISMVFVFAGLLALNVSNILNELHLIKKTFLSVMRSINYISILIIMSGLYWRFQIQLDGAAEYVASLIKRGFAVQLLRTYFLSLLLMALSLFLLSGVILAYKQTPGIEVISNPFKLLFLLLSLFLAGRSVLHFFLGSSQSLAVQMLAPLAGMTLWALVLGIGVGLHIPVWMVSIPLWGLTIFMIWRGFNDNDIRIIFPWILIAILITLLATFPYVLNGFSVYLGSPLPDGWSYVAYGQYLWHYQRGVNTGLQPLYQYAAHLSHSRYIGSSLLGFFSPLTGHVGDTQSASGFFFPTVIFVYFSSVIAFALQKFKAPLLRISFVAVAALSGWTFTVISANNFDQAVVLAFLPGMTILMETPHFNQPRWVILIAFMLAACAYSYAEMTVFVAFTIVLLSFEQISQQKLSLKHWLLGGLGILALVVILLSPFLSDLYPFLRAQFGIAGRANRPGGNLAGELLSIKYGFIALCGLGAELFATPAELLWYNIRSWLAYFLGMFLLLGIFLQFRAGKFGTVVAAVFYVGIIYYYLYVQNYPYAAYKLISISWWFMTALTVEGSGLILKTRHYLVKYISQFLYLGVLLGFLAVFFIRSDQFANSVEIKSVTPFRQLETLPIPDGEPIIASVWGWIPNEWAMYYLREHPVLVYPYRSYASQAHVIPLMEKAAPVDFGQVRAILTDQDNPFFPSQDLLWHNQLYTLWKMPAQWAYIAEVTNPEGVVGPDQPNTLWLSDQPTDLIILASQTGMYNFTFDVDDTPKLHALVVVSAGKEISHLLTASHQTIPLSLIEGHNQISMRWQSGSSSSANSNGGMVKYPLRITRVEISPSP